MFCLLDNEKKLNLKLFAATDVVNVMDSGLAGSYNVNAITGVAGTPDPVNNNLAPDVKEFYGKATEKTKEVYADASVKAKEAFAAAKEGVVEAADKTKSKIQDLAGKK